MGYCIKLVSKKKILESDVKSIIHNMPDYLRGPLDEVKEQIWGWPCICDVSKPIGQEITISGAYAMSGDKAQEFTDYFQRALDELGYDVDILYTDTVLFDEEVSKDDKSNISIFLHPSNKLFIFSILDVSKFDKSTSSNDSQL